MHFLLSVHHWPLLLYRKHAKKSREAKEQHRDSQNRHEIETGDAGLFSLINRRLGDRPSRSHKHVVDHTDQQPEARLHTSKRQSKFAESSRVPAAPKPPEPKALIAHQVSCSCVASFWLSVHVRGNLGLTGSE